jgi:hypothetical protein
LIEAVGRHHLDVREPSVGDHLRERGLGRNPPPSVPAAEVADEILAILLELIETGVKHVGQQGLTCRDGTDLLGGTNRIAEVKQDVTGMHEIEPP